MQALERKLDELIKLCDQLDSENRHLKSAAMKWEQEKDALVQKTEIAREKVEAMIARLRAMEEEA